MSGSGWLGSNDKAPKVPDGRRTTILYSYSAAIQALDWGKSFLPISNQLTDTKVQTQVLQVPSVVREGFQTSLRFQLSRDFSALLSFCTLTLGG